VTDIEYEDPGMTEEEISAISVDLDRLSRLKLERDAIEAEIDYLQAAMVKILDASQVKEIEITDRDGKPLKATVVTGATKTFDLEALADMDKSLADAVSKRVVDRARLEKAEAMGLLAQPKYQGLWKIKAKRPYILFTAPREEAVSDE
jgi:hypothetical protein